MLAMIFFFIICNEKTLEMTVSETYNNTYTSNCTPSFLTDGYKSLKQCYMKWYKWQTEQTKKHCAETNKLKRIVKFELVNFPMFCKRIKFIYCIFVFFTHTHTTHQMYKHTILCTKRSSHLSYLHLEQTCTQAQNLVW